jgi:regulator of cell morphogenesis and NO signaling
MFIKQDKTEINECHTHDQKESTGEITVGDIAAKDVRKAQTMKKLGIDFCCGGRKTLKQAAADIGLKVEDLEEALDKAGNTVSTVSSHRFNTWEADFLADYIYNEHHKYFYENSEYILELAIKIERVHGKHHPQVATLRQLIEKLFSELKSHFEKEEKVLFPYIKQLCADKKLARSPSTHFSITNGPVAMMHMEHEAAGDILRKIRKVTNDYQAPPDGCNSFRLLYKKLNELEADLHQHIHLENNILFPKALNLEKELVG